MAINQLYCTFYLGKEFFGVEVEKVQEVIRNQVITPVRLAPKTIKGLINLRGQIVAVMGLRERLDVQSDQDVASKPMNVIIHDKDGFISFQVDKIGDVVSVDMEQFQEAPETLQGPAKEMISGAYKLSNGELLMVLDVEKTKNVQIKV